MKTIPQIAKEIGVTRQAIYKKIKKEPLLTSLQGLTVMNNNKLTVDSNGETLIKTAFDKNVSITVNKKTDIVSTDEVNNITKEVDNNSDELPRSLQEQIKILTSQIESKDRLIEVLENEMKYKNEQIQALTTADRIQAESINAARHNELAETIIDGQQAIIPEISMQKEKKNGFFKKIFNKNK
jgi:predicted DNA-binding protein YlxM (UPF0122 family)